ncbi:MAG: 50S ribosomal protein L9 [Patescibacteria group bacterium]|nr:MAG: 50S ribosomal protein L9 [Patescibacteria group bacterium]
MKVILLQDILKVGRKYDAKDVPAGYARNFLIPRGLAEFATENAIKKADSMRLQYETQRKAQEEVLLKDIAKLDGATVSIEGRANEKGNLFAGIHKEEIAARIKEETGLEVNAEHVVSPQPIKEIGEYEVKIKVGDKTISLKLSVEATK